MTPCSMLTTRIIHPRAVGLLVIAALCALSTGCAIVQDIQTRQERAREELLSQATAENVSLEISLGEQRGFLLVRTAIAMDFPVATGKKSHPTPSGNFSIRGKEKNYSSNLYGKI